MGSRSKRRAQRHWLASAPVAGGAITALLAAAAAAYKLTRPPAESDETQAFLDALEGCFASQQRSCQEALSLLSDERVRHSHRQALLCDLAANFTGTRQRHFRELFVGLVERGASTACAVEVRHRGQLVPMPLALALAHDASYIMLQAALRHGASIAGSSLRLTLAGALLHGAAERSMVYGHVGLALRLNPQMPTPQMVRQCDLREHAALSPLLADYYKSRNDGVHSIREARTSPRRSNPGVWRRGGARGPHARPAGSAAPVHAGSEDSDDRRGPHHHHPNGPRAGAQHG